MEDQMNNDLSLPVDDTAPSDDSMAGDTAPSDDLSSDESTESPAGDAAEEIL